MERGLHRRKVPAPDRARNTRRRTGIGRGGDEASKRVGGFYRSAKCATAVRLGERFEAHPERAARSGTPVSYTHL